MPYETMRFIHAARVLVDQPLSDTGSIASNLRGLSRNATTQAFQNLVAACLEHDVDFLLLTGDTLEQTDYSIKARVELRHGFEELEDAGIQVFLVPGLRDPITVWDDFPELPSNVTVFRPDTDDPVAVLRDGSVIASIRSLNWRQSWFAWDDEEPHADRTQRRAKEADQAESLLEKEESAASSLIHESDDPELDGESASDSANHARHEAHREIRRVQSPTELRPNHFAIAIVRDGVDNPGDDPQADYLAVVGGRERTTSKGTDWLMHFPGSTQGRSPDESGLHGCSLVDLDSDGVIRCRFLPTAPVRWENFELDIDADTTFQQLVTRAHTACQQLCGVEAKPEQGRLVAEYGDASDDASDDASNTAATDPAAVSEALHAQACFLRWTIRGNGPLFDGLFKDEMQNELIEWLDDDVQWPLEVPRLHRIRLLAAEPAVSRMESDTDDEQLDVPTEFFWRVDQAQPLGKSAWNELGGDSSVERERFAQLQAATAEGDAAVVFSLARRRGWKWFRGANM